MTHWLFGFFSTIWAPLKRYYADSGIFEKALVSSEDPIYPEDFEQYTTQFVCQLKSKFKDVFEIDLCEIEKTNEDSPVAYTEIFNLCRTVVLRHSEASAGRDFFPIGSIQFCEAVGEHPFSCVFRLLG